MRKGDCCRIDSYCDHRSDARVVTYSLQGSRRSSNSDTDTMIVMYLKLDLLLRTRDVVGRSMT